jgi:tetratricopeptide (TPR) repeat protein
LEVLTLRDHLGSVWGVAISRDHHRLATASLDGTVKIRDARPWTEDSSAEREALGQLAFLFARPLPKADVIEYLRGSTTIRARAQQMALALVGRYHEETDADSYHRASWAAVRQRYLNSFQYRFALMQARRACCLAGDRAGYRTALGAAQYRVGRYLEALETLRQANRDEKLVLANLAFQAIVQHQLGRTEVAQATVVRLREMMRQLPGTVDSEARALVREAEALMNTRAEDPK